MCLFYQAVSLLVDNVESMQNLLVRECATYQEYEQVIMDNNSQEQGEREERY